MRWPLLILLAAPLALVACGGGSSHNASPPPVKLDPVAYVRHAASHTARAQSEHETLTGTVMAAGHEVTLHGSGDFSNSKGQGSMTATFSAEGMNGSIDEVLDGTTIYMSSPLFSGSLPNGKTWMKLDLAKAYASQGINFSSLMSQSPEQGLKRLQGAGKVTSVGTDTIDGAETTHFRVTHLDVSKIPQGSKIEALIHAKFGATNVWVDKAHGYVRRMSLSASYSYDGHSASMSLTLDLSRFGEPVHVNLPPASKTFDATGAAIQGLGG
jgi:hypothetical protein